MKVLVILAAVFGLGLLSVSVFGGLVSLFGAYLLWSTARKESIDTPAKRRKAIASGLIVTLLWGPIAGGIAYLGGYGGPLTAKRGEAQKVAKRNLRGCTDTTMAYIMSQRFVKRELRSPSTAKFPSYHSDSVTVRQTGECKFHISAYVDAQNGFGATVRNRYEMSMERLPDDDSWRGTDLRM